MYVGAEQQEPLTGLTCVFWLTFFDGFTGASVAVVAVLFRIPLRWTQGLVDTPLLLPRACGWYLGSRPCLDWLGCWFCLFILFAPLLPDLTTTSRTLPRFRTGGREKPDYWMCRLVGFNRVLTLVVSVLHLSCCERGPETRIIKTPAPPERCDTNYTGKCGPSLLPE